MRLWNDLIDAIREASYSKCRLSVDIICKLALEKQEMPHLCSWTDDITCCCEGPRDPLKGVVGLQRKIVNKICEK